MNDKKTLNIIDKITKNIFNLKNDLNLDEIPEKYAFGIKLPK